MVTQTLFPKATLIYNYQGPTESGKWHHPAGQNEKRKRSALHPRRREAWSFQPVGVLCTLGAIASGVGWKGIPTMSRGVARIRESVLSWCLPCMMPCACRFLLGGGNQWPPFKLITLCSGEQSGNRRKAWRESTLTHTHSHTHCSASTMLLSLLPAGGRPAPGTASAGSLPPQKLPGCRAGEAGGRDWRLARRRAGRRERAPRKSPRVEAPCSCPKGVRGDGARLAPRRGSAAGLLPLEGAGYSSCFSGTEAPGDARRRALVFCPSIPNRHRWFSSCHPRAPIFPATHFPRQHDSAELVLFLRDPLGQVPLLLPPAPAPLPSQPGNAKPGPFQPSSGLLLSPLNLMDYLSLSEIHHCSLVSLTSHQCRESWGVPSSC